MPASNSSNSLSGAVVSRFERANDPGNPTEYTLAEFVEECMSPKWKDVIAQIRAEKDENTRRKLKSENLPVITPAGTFSYRSIDGVLAHSGHAVIDIDHLREKGHDPIRLRDKLITDPHVAVSLLSPGGDGVKLFLPIEPSIEHHTASFNRAKAYFLETYGLEIDPSGSDISRACFLAHDPDAKVNTNAKPLPWAKPPPFADIAKIIAGGLRAEKPSVVSDGNGSHLLYAGRINEFHSEPSTGKTNLLLLCAREVMQAGGKAMLLDFEDHAEGILQRMQSLGFNLPILPGEIFLPPESDARRDPDRRRMGKTQQAYVHRT